MSLCTATAGTPHRVWALLRTLEALEGVASEEMLLNLVHPRFSAGGRSEETSSATFDQTLQAALDIGLVRRDPPSARDGRITLDGNGSGTLTDLSDRVHDILVALPPSDSDSLILDGYAVVGAAADDRGGTNWFLSLTREQQVQHLNLRLGSETSGTRWTFNTDRLAAWQRWIGFLGLSAPMPGRRPPYPYLAPRIAREIARAAGTTLPRDTEIPAAEFLSWLARRMPYIDGGERYRALTGHGVGAAPRTARTSHLLSGALRDLHDDGVIALSTMGDAADNIPLADDSFHPVKAFRALVVH